MKIHTYAIQSKLHTLAKNAVVQNDSTDSFELVGIKFQQWDFSWAYGHKGDAWLVSGKIEAENCRQAWKEFSEKLNQFVPKISFISQCYSNHLAQPFLICREGENVAYFHYSRSCNGVGLDFSNSELQALQELLSKENQIPEKFFYYWNDMINCASYPGKFLLLNAALDSLSPQEDRKKKREEVLGSDLAKQLFDNKGGARHKAAHGDYFPEDFVKLMNQSYEKVISYFNTKVFSEFLIKNVRYPQRNPYDNLEFSSCFYELTSNNAEFDFKKMVNGCDDGGIDPVGCSAIKEPLNY